MHVDSLRCSKWRCAGREAEAAKRAALEKQRAAQGLGPQGQQAERELQAATAEIEANKRCACLSQCHDRRLPACCSTQWVWGWNCGWGARLRAIVLNLAVHEATWVLVCNLVVLNVKLVGCCCGAYDPEVARAAYDP